MSHRKANCSDHRSITVLPFQQNILNRNQLLKTQLSKVLTDRIFFSSSKERQLLCALHLILLTLNSIVMNLHLKNIFLYSEGRNLKFYFDLIYSIDVQHKSTAILFRSFGFIAPKYFSIIWLYNISIFSVPDEVYSRNALCALNQISTFLFPIMGENIFLI